MSVEEALAKVNEAIVLTNTKDYVGAWAKIADIPEDCPIWTNAGAAKTRGLLIWQGTGDVEGAQAWFEKVVREHPDDPSAQMYNEKVGVEIKKRAFKEARALLQANKLEEAEAAYAAISLEPPINDDIRIGVSINHGSCLMGLKRNFEALQMFETAIELKHNCLEAHFNRGVLLKSDSRYSDAFSAFAEALKIKPDLSQAISASFECLRQSNRAQDLLDFCNDILDKGTLGNDFRPFFYRAFCNCDLKNYEASLSDGKEAYSRDIKEPFHTQLTSLMVRCHREFGEELLASGDSTSALEHYEEALKMVQIPTDQQAVLLSKANLLNECGDTAAATALLESCIRSFPDALQFREKLGMLQVKLGNNLDQAMENLSLSLAGELQASQVDSLYTFGVLQSKQGDAQKALALFVRCVELDPSHEEARRQVDELNGTTRSSKVKTLPPTPPLEASVPPPAEDFEEVPPDFIASAEEAADRPGYTFLSSGPSGSGYYKTFIPTKNSDADTQSVSEQMQPEEIRKLEEQHDDMYEWLPSGPMGPGLYEKTEMRRMKAMGWTDEFIRVKLRIAPMRRENEERLQAEDLSQSSPSAEVERAVVSPDKSYLTPGDHTFPYEELTSGLTFPPGVDPAQREMYLSDAEFVQHLKATKKEWAQTPKWRQNNVKRGAKLF